MLELSESQYGHDLQSILIAAEQNGLSALVELTDEQRNEITKATTYYAGKVFEYPALSEAVIAYAGTPKLEVLLAAGEILTLGLAQPCQEAR